MNNSSSAPSQNREAGIPSNAQPSRTLKIELLGDSWRRKTFSGIRIKGRWLTNAGFLPGQRVSLKFTSPGVMELRILSDSASAGSGEPQVMRQTDLALASAKPTANANRPASITIANHRQQPRT
jgi:hypothetical protein